MTATKIKRILAIGLSCYLCVSFTACKPDDLKINKEYVFKEISFRRSEELTFGDIAQFVPNSPTVIGENPIDTIEEFEEYIQDNIHSFTFMRKQNDEWEEIDASAKDSIKFYRKGRALRMITKKGAQEQDYACVVKGNYILTKYPIHVITCKDNTAGYVIPMVEGFQIVYTYELKQEK